MPLDDFLKALCDRRALQAATPIRLSEIAEIAVKFAQTKPTLGAVRTQPLATELDRIVRMVKGTQ